METGKDRHSQVCPFIETAERWNDLNYMSLTPHPNRRSKSPLVSYFQKKRHLHLYQDSYYSSCSSYQRTIDWDGDQQTVSAPVNYR